MELYAKKSRWKIYLAIGGLLIVAISMAFTNYLANKLAQEERKKAENWLVALERTATAGLDNCDYTLHQKILESNTTIPVILVNDRGGIDHAINFGEEQEQNDAFLKRELEKMRAANLQPIVGTSQTIWYKESTLLRLIKFFPIIQFFLIAAFITFGYIGFSSARRAEQNRVWVGMAKETAHQLGTPISAIVAWIEHLKTLKKGDGETQEILEELTKDVKRLDLIADRFSKIGSAPALQPVNIYDELEKCRAYMQRRASRKVVFDFPGIEHTPAYVKINPHLFDWVIENLLRNSLDAMQGTGTISAIINNEKEFVNIDITDSGKGIAPSKFKTVFQPGFTTKTRGWGLGLSLAKRIIETYHSGRIFVKKSVVNEGTTFTIKLPKAQSSEHRTTY